MEPVPITPDRLLQILPDGIVDPPFFTCNGFSFHLYTSEWWNDSTGQQGRGLDHFQEAVRTYDESLPTNTTDLGNARRFIREHRGNVRYVERWKAWIAWSGNDWVRNYSGVIERKAKDTVMHIYNEAMQAEDFTQREALTKHALRSESAARLAAMLQVAQTEGGVSIGVHELDRDGWLVGCPNGTLDLRTGVIRTPTREDLITKRLGIPYHATATAPTWDAFLARIIPDSDMRVFLQRACGYALTGSVREQVLFILHGSGANGKTTFLEAIRHVMGDYAVQVPIEALAARPPKGEQNTPALATLHGSRFAVSVESDENLRFGEGLIKQLTSEERLTVCRKFENPFEFTPTHKLFIGTNHKPMIRGTDNGIWRRMRLTPFTVTIPPEERDKNLLDKLRAEGPGILAWMVRGCLDWQRDGLTLPDLVSVATNEYRSEMDVIGAFIESACVINSHAQVSAENLYKRYSEWSKNTGEYQMNQRQFGKKMTERGFERFQNNGVWYRGIGVSASNETF